MPFGGEMQRIFHWTGILLFTLVSVFFIAFGILYASVTQLLSFHAAAVPAPALVLIQPLYFALMKLIGGGAIGVGVLGLYITWLPLRRGTLFAGGALTVAFAIPLVLAAMSAEYLRRSAGAPTSWHLMGILLAITACAFACSLLGRGAAYFARGTSTSAL